MKKFLEFLIKSIVTNPDSVRIEEDNQGKFINLTIHVEDEDMGIVIGKEGKSIRSIRNLVKSKAIKDDVRVNVELFDPKHDEI